MAGNGKGTLLTIVENVRDAAVAFGKRFSPPHDPRAAVTELLAELGIADPTNAVRDALADATAAWIDLTKSLSGVDLNFVDPVDTSTRLSKQAAKISDDIAAIIEAPQNAIKGVENSAVAIRKVFPKRLLDFIIYDFITNTHPKIAGAFLVLGVLRREPQPGGNPALIKDRQIRVFDLQQFVRALTDPRGSFLTVMRWGTDDFLARPVVDGLALLLGTVSPSNPPVGPADDVWPIGEEAKFLGPLPPALLDSARRTVNSGLNQLAFVGLHRHGLGLLVPNPIMLTGNIIPPLGEGAMLTVQPGNPPTTADPEVKVLSA